MNIGIEKDEGNLRYFALRGENLKVRVRIPLYVYNMPDGPKKDFFMQGFLKKLLIKAKRMGVNIKGSSSS